MGNVLIKTFLSFIVLIVLYFYSIQVYRLASKAYIIDENKLCKLDTFRLYNRAYITSDGRYRQKDKLRFYAINGYSFSIIGNVFESITNKQQLKNILLYDDDNFMANTTLNRDVAFIVYTKRKEFEKYNSTAYPTSIAVYQIQIGNTKYIDISKLNNLNQSSLKTNVIPPAFLAAIVILIVAIRPVRKRILKLFPNT